MFESFKTVALKSRGRCSVCDLDSVFVARDPWLRDHFVCRRCGSIPRERAIMHVIENWYPDWKELIIHESSPINRGASNRLRNECRNYLPSQYFEDVSAGSKRDGVQCEDLRELTFADESIDLHVTQDVLEHVFEPERVFAELARTLRPGGAHICTVPLVRGSKPSRERARLQAGKVQNLLEAEYHGNPLSADGSLVVTDWGFDICQRIFEASGLFTVVIQIDDLSLGIRAEYIEVLVTRKL